MKDKEPYACIIFDLQDLGANIWSSLSLHDIVSMVLGSELCEAFWSLSYLPNKSIYIHDSTSVAILILHYFSHE